MPNIHTIPLSFPFADTLAEEILQQYGDDPLTLSSVTLLLPSRRAARAMREAFLRVTAGKPLLLPAMRGLGDVEEDEASLWENPAIPPAISPLRRQLILAEMIGVWGRERGQVEGRPVSREQAMQMAYELAAFLDEVQRHELPLGNLKHIVPEDLAVHWQVTLDFFDVLANEWPRKLKALGLIDPIAHRNLLLDAQVAEWERNPSVHPVIAAGTTGSTPATLRLLKAIVKLPQGRVVLQGLDTAMPEDQWEKLEEHHPQYALKVLLEGLGANRAEIALSSTAQISPREALLSSIMSPAGATAQWQHLPEQSLRNITRMDAPALRQEAEAIALMLRYALETPDKRAALVTNDRELAGRVASLMERWNIAIDDSAGVNLADTPPVAFMKLVAEMVASGFAPVPLLAALKHPLATAGMEQGVFRHKVRQLELAVLRGLRPQAGIGGIRAALAAQGRTTPELNDLLDRLEHATGRFAQYYAVATADAIMRQHDTLQLLSAHSATAEALAGGAVLWESGAGGQARAWLETVQDAAKDTAPLSAREYPQWFETLWLGRKFRLGYGLHPRLAILSPMEARLQRYDLMILGGMNEGSWPPARPGAWMNRQMRRDFGLPSEEFYTGLSARDFVECCTAPEVVFTRAQKAAGKPAIASPWLLRLDAVLQSRGLGLEQGAPWLAWANAFHDSGEYTPLAPPQPKPPLAARPQKFSVTEVEKWMRDPYAIYARRILGLKKLDDLDQDPEARDYGTLLHGIFEAFIREIYTVAVPEKEQWLSLLLRHGEEHFRTYDAMPAVRKLWWPRFERIAAWFVDMEWERRPEIVRILPEVRGEMTVNGVTLTAKSDRVECLKDGTLRIVDYKTGQPPTMVNVARGLAAQLTLTALIAEACGFNDIQGEVSALEYWRLSATEPGTRSALDLRKSSITQAKADTREGFSQLLAAFADESTAYLACPDSQKAPDYNDYEHLERVKEWSVGEDA